MAKLKLPKIESELMELVNRKLIDSKELSFRKKTSLYLDRHLYEELQKSCKKKGLSVSEVLDELILMYLGGIK